MPASFKPNCMKLFLNEDSTILSLLLQLIYHPINSSFMKVPRLHHFCSFSVDGSWFANFAKILVRNVVLVKAHAHHVLPDTEIDKGAFVET